MGKQTDKPSLICLGSFYTGLGVRGNVRGWGEAMSQGGGRGMSQVEGRACQRVGEGMSEGGGRGHYRSRS